MNEIANYQISDEWKYLVEDCKTIISQRIKNSRREVILAYAEIGNRIVEDSLYKKYGKGMRVHNFTAKTETWRCTVCERIKEK